MLVGNKIDLEDQRVVSTEEGQALAKEYGLMFMETSAKTAENVTEAFMESAQKVIAKMDLEGGQTPAGQNIVAGNENKKKAKCC